MRTGVVLVAVAAVIAAGFFAYNNYLDQGDQRELERLELNNSTQRTRDVTVKSKEISIEDQSFNPVNLEINSSEDGKTTVTWVNRDQNTYYLTLLEDEKTVFSRTLPGGENFSWPVYQEKEYVFVGSDIGVNGTITVN